MHSKHCQSPDSMQIHMWRYIYFQQTHVDVCRSMYEQFNSIDTCRVVGTCYREKPPPKRQDTNIRVTRHDVIYPLTVFGGLGDVE